MSIDTVLSLLLQEYVQARSQPFAKNAMADLLRVDIHREIEAAVVNTERYEVVGRTFHLHQRKP